MRGGWWRGELLRMLERGEFTEEWVLGGQLRCFVGWYEMREREGGRI